MLNQPYVLGCRGHAQIFFCALNDWVGEEEEEEESIVNLIVIEVD